MVRGRSSFTTARVTLEHLTRSHDGQPWLDEILAQLRANRDWLAATLAVRVDDAIEAAILEVVEPSAITAAIEADAQQATRRDMLDRLAAVQMA